MTACSFKGCPRAATTRGLCPGHYRQQLRGGPLRPLRGERGRIGEAPLRQLTVWLPAATLDALEAEGPSRGEAARIVLERWAKEK